MKTKLILRGYTIIFSVLILLPSLLILVNNYLGLSIYKNRIAQIVGLLLVLSGILVVYHCLRLFIKIGKGAPVPTEQPEYFVSSGLYRYSRNPMYLGAFFILLGEFLILGPVLLFCYFLLCTVGFHLNVVLREEPSLQKKFGEKYVEYKNKVPRWFPRLSNRF